LVLSRPMWLLSPFVGIPSPYGCGGQFMASDSPAPVRPVAVVRIEARVGSSRPTIYEVGDGGFLVGSVPGCDLRLPGPNLAPVLCLIARQPTGAVLRKLAPAQPPPAGRGRPPPAPPRPARRPQRPGRHRRPPGLGRPHHPRPRRGPRHR